jgi:nifR3 family TIM-barrel protein
MCNQAEPAFRIGRVPIYGTLVLSPMAGYSDVPFRGICRRMGAAYSYTSCVLDDAVLQWSHRTQTLADFSPAERPIAIQMLGKDEERLLEACWRIMETGPDIIDLNLGCPARHVSWRGRGAALLREPARIGRIMSRLARELPVPVTAKIRLGWDEPSRNYLEVAHILEESGAAAIAVHGRTKEQGYSGRADWLAIAEVKASVRLPVLANGDVRTLADIAAIRAATACDGVLIGRGAVGNPWIFSSRDITTVSWPERQEMMRQHLAAMVDYYGEHVGVILFRKHAIRYIQELPGATALRPLLVACETAEALHSVLAEWSPQN